MIVRNYKDVSARQFQSLNEILIYIFLWICLANTIEVSEQLTKKYKDYTRWSELAQHDHMAPIHENKYKIFKPIEKKQTKQREMRENLVMSTVFSLTSGFKMEEVNKNPGNFCVTLNVAACQQLLNSEYRTQRSNLKLELRSSAIIIHYFYLKIWDVQYFLLSMKMYGITPLLLQFLKTLSIWDCTHIHAFIYFSCLISIDYGSLQIWLLFFFIFG